MNQKNIYEVQLHGVNGEENFLQQFKGKVTLIINVTGHCGNAPQFGIIQKIYDHLSKQNDLSMIRTLDQNQKYMVISEIVTTMDQLIKIHIKDMELKKYTIENFIFDIF